MIVVALSSPSGPDRSNGTTSLSHTPLNGSGLVLQPLLFLLLSDCRSAFCHLLTDLSLVAVAAAASCLAFYQLLPQQNYLLIRDQSGASWVSDHRMYRPEKVVVVVQTPAMLREELRDPLADRAETTTWCLGYGFLYATYSTDRLSPLKPSI